MMSVKRGAGCPVNPLFLGVDCRYTTQLGQGTRSDSIQVYVTGQNAI